MEKNIEYYQMSLKWLQERYKTYHKLIDVVLHANDVDNERKLKEIKDIQIRFNIPRIILNDLSNMR